MYTPKRERANWNRDFLRRNCLLKHVIEGKNEWHRDEDEDVSTGEWVCSQKHNSIQGDSGGICTTLGNDSMSDSKQKKFIRTWVRF